VEDHLRTLMRGTKHWAYLDIKINNFDPFNDVYTFAASDDVIRFFSLLVNEVLEEYGAPEDFVGQPGKDNFVIITHSNEPDQLKQRLIERFDDEVKQHYSFIDRDRGYMLVPDSDQGERQTPLMTLAVGLVSTQTHQFSDIREVTELAAEDRRLGLSGVDASSRTPTSW